MDPNPPTSSPVNQNPSAPIQSFQSTPSNPNLSPKKSGFKKWIILGIAVVLLLAIGVSGGYFLNSQMTENNSAAPSPTPATSDNEGEQIVCTMDAKECPDGSFVSRQGPKCEFAACPTKTTSSSPDTSDWKTYSNSKYGVSIDYPANWTLNSQEEETVPKGAFIFSIYETTPSSVRVDFHKNFVGDFCNGQSLTTEKITINGRSAERLNCDGNPQAIKYPVSGDDFWLIGVFVTKENADTFEKIFESFTIN